MAGLFAVATTPTRTARRPRTGAPGVVASASASAAHSGDFLVKTSDDWMKRRERMCQIKLALSNVLTKRTGNNSSEIRTFDTFDKILIN